MEIEICPVGGYGEVGRNMTAIKVGNEVVIIDMGIHVPNYIALTEDEDIKGISVDALRAAKAIPNDKVISDIRNKVIAIIPTHAHLDHLGAIPFMAEKYDAPVIATPFTIEVLKAILKNEKINIPNKLCKVNINSKMKLSENIEAEFVNVTHSTPQSVMVVLHTKRGCIVYANDFKFDLTPTMGKKVNMKRLEEIGKENVIVLIVESLYSNEAIKMPSEAVAKEMLKEVLLGTNNEGRVVIVSTFSSHIARLKSIIEFGNRMRRRVLLLGRSISKYVMAAEAAGIANFSKEVEIVKYSSKIKKRLKKIKESERAKYLLVMTGHQGEPQSTLAKIAFGDIRFKLEPEDHVVFSSKVIPCEENIRNRNALDNRLRQEGVRIFENIHISGHAGKEDLRDLISLLKPRIIIPSHGKKSMEEGIMSLALEMGYDKRQVQIVRNGERLKVA